MEFMAVWASPHPIFTPPSANSCCQSAPPPCRRAVWSIESRLRGCRSRGHLGSPPCPSRRSSPACCLGSPASRQISRRASPPRISCRHVAPPRCTSIAEPSSGAGLIAGPAGAMLRGMCNAYQVQPKNNASGLDAAVSEAIRRLPSDLVRRTGPGVVVTSGGRADPRPDAGCRGLLCRREFPARRQSSLSAIHGASRGGSV